MKKYEPRFEDCPMCKWFNKKRPVAQCLNCDIGQNFEESFAEIDPLLDFLLTKMDRSNDDDQE